MSRFPVATRGSHERRYFTHFPHICTCPPEHARLSNEPVASTTVKQTREHHASADFRCSSQLWSSAGIWRRDRNHPSPIATRKLRMETAAENHTGSSGSALISGAASMPGMMGLPSWRPGVVAPAETNLFSSCTFDPPGTRSSRAFPLASKRNVFSSPSGAKTFKASVCSSKGS